MSGNISSRAVEPFDIRLSHDLLLVLSLIIVEASWIPPRLPASAWLSCRWLRNVSEEQCKVIAASLSTPSFDFAEEMMQRSI